MIKIITVEQIKRFVPTQLKKYLHYIVKSKKRDEEFANFILNSAKEYSVYINGDSNKFSRKLETIIIKSENDCNSIIQDILIAFMKNYEENLYQYYKNQEYLIFYRFLTYPFNSDMSSYFLPYERALSRTQNTDILDYGSGIPYGLIYSMLKNKNSIRSITLVDLDLIHLDFVQFLIKRIAPNIELRIYRLTDTNSFPKLEGKFDFFFGKDIFEHLSDPLKNLKELIKYSKDDAICYFDFQDHGEKIYQHISPDINFLTLEMESMGFQVGNKICGLSEFIKMDKNHHTLK